MNLSKYLYDTIRYRHIKARLPERPFILNNADISLQEITEEELNKIKHDEKAYQLAIELNKIIRARVEADTN